jgi:hypothetical protein
VNETAITARGHRIEQTLDIILGTFAKGTTTARSGYGLMN